MMKSANLLHKCGLGDSDMSSTVATGEGTRFPADCPKEKKIIAEINL